MERQRETSRYSFVYNALVEEENDFVGLVAYSIYKKILYVRRFEEKNKRPPTPEELQEFHAQAHDRIDQYKDLATTRVANFYDTVYKSQYENIEAEYRKKFIEKVENLRPHWLAGICQSIIGSYLYTSLIGVIAVLLLYSQLGLGWVVKKAIDSQPVIEMPEGK
ncbi:MAG: hypothetical protein K6E40_12445 [Desulfovibrio sp.]|nr:hypothetical protein [Desulfovibrio sp.]